MDIDIDKLIIVIAKGSLLSKACNVTYSTGDELTRDTFDGWMEDPNEKKMYVLSDKKSKVIYSTLMISKMDFDPDGMHSDPWCLNLLFVPPKFRRNGCASRLMHHVSHLLELTLFCKDSLMDFYRKFDFRFMGITGFYSTCTGIMMKNRAKHNTKHE